MKKLIRIISLVLLGLLGFAGTAGAVTVSAGPTTCVTLGGANQDWSNTNRAQAQDSSYATATVNDGEVTDPLQCTGYGFAIPAGAVTNGITVTLWRLASNNSCCTDLQMRLVKAGTIQATDRSTATFPRSARARPRWARRSDRSTPSARPPRFRPAFISAPLTPMP